MSTVDGRAGSPWRVPFVRPDLPSADELAPVFRRIIASGTLTRAVAEKPLRAMRAGMWLIESSRST